MESGVTPDAIIQIVQELGLGVALAVAIFWQLRRTLDAARDERQLDRVEREKLIQHLVDEGRETRDVLRGLDSTLSEIRGVLIGSRDDKES